MNNEVKKLGAYPILHEAPEYTGICFMLTAQKDGEYCDGFGCCYESKKGEI